MGVRPARGIGIVNEPLDPTTPPPSVAIDGVDALIAAVGRELDAPVVSAGRDLTHEGTIRVVDVEEYRD